MLRAVSTSSSYGGGGSSGPIAITAAGSGLADGDSLFDYVKLLLKFEGANNSTTILDSSQNPKSVVVLNAAKISTTHVIAGSSSGYTNGGGDSFWIGSDADFSFSNVEFCIEGKFNTTSVANESTLFVRNNIQGGFNNGAFIVRINSVGSDGKLKLWAEGYNGGTPMLVTSSGGFNDGNDHHWALTKKFVSDTTYRWDLWVDGTSLANNSNAANIPDNLLHMPLIVGVDHSSGASLAAYQDDIRVTVGHYRYDHAGGSFTPASDLPDYAGKIVVTITDNTSGVSAFRAVAVDADTGREVGVATIASGTEITIECDALVPCFVTVSPRDVADYGDGTITASYGPVTPS